MKNLTFLFLLILLISSCDEEPVNIPPFEGIISDRVIFIEDLTGVKCPNCPKGSAKLEALKQIYPLNFVVVGVHGDFLCDPLGESKYDFRNEDAEDLENKLGWIAKPSAVINRIKFDDQDYQGIDNVDLWQQYLEDLMEQPHEMELSIATTYDPGSRQLKVDVTATPLVTKSGDFRFTVMVTESDIDDAQEYPDRIAEEYVHDHILRKILSNIDGDAAASGITAGQTISKSYTYEIPEIMGNYMLNPEHMEVAAFVSENIDGQDIVMQAAGKKLFN